MRTITSALASSGETAMAHSEMGIAGAAPAFRELRRWPRLKIRVPVTVIVKKPNKTVYVDGRGTDLNEGGIAVFAGAELGIGEEVEISFTPPYHGEPLVARTIIRALADDGSGFRVEGGEQRRRPMPLVIMGPSLGLPRPHRQQRLGPIQGLDLRL